MNYIIQLFHQYFICHNEGDSEWAESYDPRKAKCFSSKEEARGWVDTKTAFGEDALVVKKDEEVAAFEKWMKNGMIRRVMPMVDTSLSRPYKNEGKLEVLEWRIKQSLAPDSAVRYEDYETWPDLYQKFKHLFEISQYHSSDYKEKYLSFVIRVSKNDKTSDFFREELDLVLDYITFKDENGNQILDVIDHKLGEGGDSVTLVVLGKDKFEIRGRSGRPLIQGDLKKVFRYLVDNRWYD